MHRFVARPVDDHEAGIAMITAILVTVIVLILSVTAVGLATHNSTASGRDRNRTQAVHAGEAAINSTLEKINASAPMELPCALTGSLTTSPRGTFSATIQYYPSFPPVAGQELLCTTATRGWSADNPPDAVMITGVGLIGGVRRTMQTQAKMYPRFGGFGAAVFSDADFTIRNNLSLSGNDGNDGHVYSTQSIRCENGAEVHGNLIAQDEIELNNGCHVLGDVWARNEVRLNQNSLVDGNARSSTSRIVNSNNSDFRVLGDGKAGTTIFRPTKVRGTKQENVTPQEIPPGPDRGNIGFPQLTFDRGAWENVDPNDPNDERYEYESGGCAAATSKLGEMASRSVNVVFEVTEPGCTININRTYEFAADFGLILNEARLVVQQSVDLDGVSVAGSDAVPRIFHIIVPTGTTCGANADGDGGVHFQQRVQLDDVVLGLFSECYADFENNEDLEGQIYARHLDVDQYFNMGYVPALFPGGGVITGHELDVTFVREIKNPPAP